MTPTFSFKNFLTLLIIPLELTVGWLIHLIGLTQQPLMGQLAAFLIFFLGFLAAVSLNKELLRQSWPNYRKNLFRNLFLSLFFAILFGLIQQVGRGFIQSGSIAFNNHYLTATLIPTLVGALIPIMAPFTEEIVFRHLLFFQWADSRGKTFFLLFGSSILFGLAHFNNYSGNLIYTLPLMVGGLMLALLYRWKKNIWFNIMAHFIYNFTLAVLPAVIVLIFQGLSN